MEGSRRALFVLFLFFAVYTRPIMQRYLNKGGIAMELIKEHIKGIIIGGIVVLVTFGIFRKFKG